MRVVYLADAPYVHTRRWVEHFARLGWEAHVISFRPADIEGATVHYIDGLEPIGKARYLVHARRVRALIDQLQPDLLHALHLTSYGFLAGLSGYRPSIVSVWGTDVLEAPSLSPMHRWITTHALARAGAVTATGLRLAEATLAYMPKGKPVTVIPYGVDIERFRPQPRERRERPVVGAVSRLSPEKGFEHLLRAAALLRDRGVEMRVLLAGDGPSRAALGRCTEELELTESVEFLGEIAHEDVPSVLRRLDIFAMPSTWEGFGVSAVEASAMELPVVASNIHGIPDVVLDGETGILVPPGDPPAIAAAIERLCVDRRLRETMGQAGRAFVEREYSWSDNAALMERLYASMLREKSRMAE
ncbi:MAG: glycosyltransferase family 4 protein [Chloroflexota bacterium]|nr:glycosyltransferase family 4 protein [Chloroflexota bacterium]